MPQGNSAVRPTNGLYLLPFRLQSFYKILDRPDLDRIPWTFSRIITDCDKQTKGQKKKCGRKQKWPIRKYKHGILLKVMRKNKDSSRFTLRHLKQASQKSKTSSPRSRQNLSLNSCTTTSKLGSKNANKIVKTKHFSLSRTPTTQNFLPKRKTVNDPISSSRI